MLNQDQENHLNSPIIPKEIETVIKCHPKIKAQEQMGLVKNSIRLQNRPHTNTFQTIPQIKNKKKTMEFIL